MSSEHAFPFITPSTGISNVEVGLTKREYFAAMAMQGLISGRPDAGCDAPGYAADAVRYADALLAALNGGSDG